MTKKLPNEEDLRTTSRDLLRAYKFALDDPNRGLISSSEFSNALGLRGRALGGVMAGASKVAHMPILIRQGVTKISRSGNYESREQLWSLNPEIPKGLLKELWELLNSMRLDILQLRCPNCDHVGVERIRYPAGAAGEGKHLPSGSFRCCSCGKSFNERELRA